MLKTDEIRAFIGNDDASERKRLAKLGQRYYDGDHDIKQKRIFFINADGKFQEDPTKVNTRISHPFWRELVDQTVQYLMSSEDVCLVGDDQIRTVPDYM